MSWLVRPDGSGSQTYRQPGFELDLRTVRLAAGAGLEEAPAGRETVIVLLSGRVEIAGDATGTLQRDDVFGTPPAAVYVGPGRRVSITASSAAELALVGAPADGDGVCRIISDARFERRGRAGFERTVANIVDRDFPARRLLVGETINDAGNWSSFPPHKHDTAGPEEACLQEVYLFRVDPADGFGFQRLYDHGQLDETYTVRDGDVVWIPRGYHPVAVMPGHRIYYLWALAGDGRDLKMNTEPTFRWLL